MSGAESTISNSKTSSKLNNIFLQARSFRPVVNTHKKGEQKLPLFHDWN